MDNNPNELSSSPMSFGSSSYISNGSSCPNGLGSSATWAEPTQSLDHLSLTKLSSNLEKLLIDDDFVDYTDAEIVVEGVPVGVHRCILASRSQFFHDLFKKGDSAAAGGGGGDDSATTTNNHNNNSNKPRYVMSEFMPFGRVGLEAFDVFLNYLYTGTGKLKASPPEISTCVDENCAHDACPPAINYAVELMYASAVFQTKELVLLVQRRLLNFVEKALVEDVIPILVAAFHCQLSQLLSNCVHRISKSNLDDVALDKELPYEVSSEIKSLRTNAQQEDETDSMVTEDTTVPAEDKRVGRILKALDSDDIELMNLLLNESDITLDDACALHYSAAYCDPKIVKEILSLNMADINLRNRRGHTVLHVAARRKEPSVIVALLERGANAAQTTFDGQTAVAICRRLTRPKDYGESTKQGQKTSADRICIDVLEREMRRSSIAGTVPMATELVADDLHARLDYFDNRVAFARLLFPTEAKLAMEMADAHTSAMYARLGGSKGSMGNLREVDLNETPSRRTKRLQYKLQTLMKTVETGRKYFPHCSEVLDKFLDDEIDLPDVYVLEKGTPEEQSKKKMRFMELKEEVHKAFSKDMAENNKSVLSSSSSSSPPLKDAAAATKPRKRS